MSNSLLFIPDISGYTNFIQNTEIEHAEHVIAEILELLIAANTQNLQLAEIEGDALFFYKAGSVLSQEKLLAQIETMFTAFHSHLKMMEKNRICVCKACATAPNLRLKIIVHSGEMKFLTVQNNKKPFGNAVITAHRLLKNSIKGDNYVVISKQLAGEIELDSSYKSKLFCFEEASDVYDGITVPYLHTAMDVSRLKLKPFAEPKVVHFKGEPAILFEETFNCSATHLLESITNYKYRSLWVKGVDSFEYNEKEVTRLGSEHVCNVNGKQLDFITVTKESDSDEVVYGELTTSPPPVDELYNFFIIRSVDEKHCSAKIELYIKAKSPLKKLMLLLFVKKVFRANMANSISLLKDLVSKH